MTIISIVTENERTFNVHVTRIFEKRKCFPLTNAVAPSPVTGADSVKSYQTIIRQIIYFNRKPAYYLNRAFKLSCSELNGRFISNEYVQTLTVVHPKGPSTNGRVASTNDDSTGPRVVKSGHHSNQFTREQVTSSSSSSSSSLSSATSGIVAASGGDKIDDQHLSSNGGNKIGYESSAVNSAVTSTVTVASASSSQNSIHHQQTPIQAKIQIQKQKVEMKDSHVRPASANSFVHHSASNLGELLLSNDHQLGVYSYHTLDGGIYCVLSFPLYSYVCRHFTSITDRSWTRCTGYHCRVHRLFSFSGCSRCH